LELSGAEDHKKCRVVVSEEEEEEEEEEGAGGEDREIKHKFN